MKEFLIVSFILFSLFSCKDDYSPLPKLGDIDVEYSTVNGKEITDTIYPKMIDFMYLNQDSVLVHSKQMKDKIWVADFFFTSCPTICPKMTAQMNRLNKNLSDLSDQIQFMSFSINPKKDSPSVLRKYIKKKGVTAKNWYFFTGDEDKTHELGIKHFKLFAGQDEASAGGYAHSPAFTLVDKEGYVRGVYIGTDPKEVDRMGKDIRLLLKHEYGIDGSK
ncbi:MAG: SCO family protein [Crocinitomicaceae bacterium]|jgi:protein SCO1/2|nr:SCO family protein [Crocinitomicaceae bacterium]